MRPHLRNGCLVPPRNLADGIERHRLLPGDILRVQGQLDDPARANTYNTPSEYATWRRRAGDILRAFRSEERLLAAWIENRHLAGEALLMEAYDQLKAFEYEFDLEPNEIAFIQKLNTFLKIASPVSRLTSVSS